MRSSAVCAGGSATATRSMLAAEIERADLDADRKRVTEEELEQARERQEELREQIERCRSLLERSRTWVGFEPEPFRDALSCSLELLGAEPLRRRRDDRGRPVWRFPALDRASSERPELGGDARHAARAAAQRAEAGRLAARGADPAGRLRGRGVLTDDDRSPAPRAARRPAAARRDSARRGSSTTTSLARVPGAGRGLDPARDPARPAVAVRAAAPSACTRSWSQSPRGGSSRIGATGRCSAYAREPRRAASSCSTTRSAHGAHQPPGARSRAGCWRARAPDVAELLPQLERARRGTGCRGRARSCASGASARARSCARRSRRQRDRVRERARAPHSASSSS